MALSERLANAAPPATGTECSLGAVIAKLNDADRTALMEHHGTPERRGLPAPAIYAALVAEGHKLSLQQINRHRSGQCRCTK